MAGYADTRQMIIDTLMGRPAGTEIQPEDHQAFALQITEYIRSVELVAGNATPIGFADADTVPVQPDNGQAVYLSSVGGAQTVTFSNFIGQNGSPISVTSTENVIKLVTLLWNGQYWSSQVTSVNAVRDTTNGYLFMGVATPSTDPGEPDQKVFYLASQDGTYTNFENIVIENEVAILSYDTIWHKLDAGIKKVTISQNTQTGGYDIQVGSSSPTNVAGQEDLNELSQNLLGGEVITPLEGESVNKYVNTVGTLSSISTASAKVYNLADIYADEIRITRVGTENIYAKLWSMLGNEDYDTKGSGELLADGTMTAIIHKSDYPNATRLAVTFLDSTSVEVVSYKDSDGAISEIQQDIQSLDERVTILEEKVTILEEGEFIPVEIGYEVIDKYVNTAGTLSNASQGCRLYDISAVGDVIVTIHREGNANPYIRVWSLLDRLEDITPEAMGEIPTTAGSYDSEIHLSDYVNAKYLAVTLIDTTSLDVTFREKKGVLNILLPQKITAVVEDELQIFFRSIIQAVNPYDYDILISCNKGKKYPRYFTFTPTNGDVGEHRWNIKVKDNNGKLLASKTTTINVVSVPSNPATPKHILCFGDSLTANGEWCVEAQRRIAQSGGTPSGLGLSNVIFNGKLAKDNVGYFGVGGWMWNSYTQKGKPAFRFQVSGVSSLSYGATYNNNGHNFHIREVNISGGSGNILCEADFSTDTPTASGTLTKVSGTGDNTITFSSAAADVVNPLWDNVNNKMTFIPYADDYCDGSIDEVITLLTWNGLSAWMTNFESLLEDVATFADTLHAEFPNAKLKILGLPMPSINGGMGDDYGATGTNYADGYGMLVTAKNLNAAYKSFAENEDYSSFVEYVDVESQFDAEYNMQHTSMPVNSRNVETEVVDINGVHPANEGYMQIADVVFRNLCAELQ